MTGPGPGAEKLIGPDSVSTFLSKALPGFDFTNAFAGRFP